ncbi:MAG TPA: VWA domain-containing protein, partial [Thermoanaerobaculia bacterium]
PKDSKAQAPTFEGTSQVVSVEVPVNAVDHDGQPVRGLTAEDFEVWDGTERQKISSFEAVDLAALEAAHTAAGPGSVQPLPELDSSARRHFLLLFDLSFSSPTAVLKARLAARDFMLNRLHPSDLAAVATFTIERGPKLVMTFTPDRAQLARAIDTLGMQHGLQVDKADPLRFIIEGDFAASGASSMMAESNRSQRDQMVFQELQALSLLAEKTERTYAIGRISDFSRSLANLGRALNAVQGRKQVVLFSEGFDSRLLIGRDTLDADNDLDNENIASGLEYQVDNDARFGSTTLQNDMHRMLEEFRRADCVIQAVDIGGLRDHTDATNRPQVNGQESLFYMANETGGELYKDTNNLGDQLNRLLNRTSLTYVLTFERSDLKTDGAYHHLRVKVAKLPAGGRLAYRSGYYAPRPFRDLSPLEKNLLASDNIAAGTPRRDIAMNVLLAPFRSSPKEAYVPVILEVGGRSLLSGQPGDKVNVEIYAYASDTQGQMRDFFTQKVGFDLSKGRKGFEETGLKYYGHLDLPPGEYRVRVLVRNAQTGHTAVESVQVQVPAYAETRPFLLPPFFIDKGAHWLMLRENDQTARGGNGGAGASVFYPFTVSGEPYVPAAKPVLHGDEKARVCLVAYNLGKGDLSVQGQVVSPDGKSAPASGLAMVERTATGISGLDKVLATFEPGALGAGDYVLQVAVTDPRTGRKEMNSLPFKVVH